MNPENVFLSNLPLIERIVRVVARRNHLSPEEAEDFSSIVKLRLIEDDYAVLRKFEGRSSLSTYLTTVITRLLAWYRIDAWGKWRPSAEAKRIGEPAITLERLMNRDGFSFDEAVAMLAHRADPAFSRSSLEAIYLRLPRRVKPASFSLDADDHTDTDHDDDSLGGAYSRDRSGKRLADDVKVTIPDDISAAERRGQAEKIGRILENVTSQLPAEDRTIIRLRFFNGMKVPQIAAQLGIDQKRLYKRIDKLLGLLRKVLEEQQISGDDVAAIIAREDIDDQIAIPNVRTIKSADIPGVYVEPATARRTLKELLRSSGTSGRK